ncbi:MAG: thiamine ABC transporter substrate-binding protein [Spirochaetes bacterium]|nr:thiamine ABC transporter substrate-binding protein [Spirochaetota bacterium]
MSGSRLARTVLAVALASGVSTAASAETILTVFTHSSFSASKEVLAAFEAESGARLRFVEGGDAGETLGKAILSKGNPVADVIFGIDNTFLGRALAADILEPLGLTMPASIPADLRLDPTGRLAPVDVGYVCLNADRAWFARRGLSLPSQLEDLVLPSYRSLLVVEDPAASSPGLAFLLATIAHFGETGAYPWQRFWQDLRANDVLVTSGWSDAYYNEFSATGKGRRPLVVSYATSPAAELFFAADPKPAEPPTVALLPDGGSFRQVEFAGVLKGTQQPELARQFVAFLLSRRFQEDIPLQMWVHPADSGARLPEVFTRFAAVPARPATLAPELIDNRRDAWTREWTRIVLK